MAYINKFFAISLTPLGARQGHAINASRALKYLHRYESHAVNIAAETQNCLALYTAISIKVVHEQSGKVEYERERLLGTAFKIH